MGESDFGTEQRSTVHRFNLSSGFEARRPEGESVFVKGIPPVQASTANFVQAMGLRTSSGFPVIPRVREVIIPRLKFDLTHPSSFRRKNERELDPAVVNNFRRAEAAALCKVRELEFKEDYEALASEFGIDTNAFLSNLSQSSLLLVESDWVGQNVANFLSSTSDHSALQRVGSRLGETLAALHKADLIAGDTHLGQFVVEGDADAVMRVDLSNIYSGNQLGSHLQQNKQIEQNELFTQLRIRSTDAADEFLQVYAKEK